MPASLPSSLLALAAITIALSPIAAVIIACVAVGLQAAIVANTPE